MKRYYGLIKDKESASVFLNKLFLAAKNGARNPIKLLSDYAYLTEIGDNAKEKALNGMYDNGIYSESRTKDGEIAILVDKTIGLNGIGLIDESEGSESNSMAVARFSDRLYLVVRPPMGEGPDIGWSRGLTDIRLVHHFPITYTPEQEEGEDPPEPVTELHTTEFHFGSNNSNALAPAVAYEITATQSYDVLVKLAWCPASTPDSEKELKSYFTSFDICCYSAAVKPREAPSAIVMKHAGKQQDVFGASGPIGGFVVHDMQKTGYGISIFGTDGTPLYTWSDNARPWDEFDSTEEYALNVNVGGLGRLISDKKFSEDSDDEDTIIKMAVLAPIFCPSSIDYAKRAKWMPQGIHDYSYFDKTGHIYLKKEEDMPGSTPVFFADHGVYLVDGELSKYTLTDRTLPDSYTVNMSIIKRPELPDLMPNADRFYAYFDSRDGVSESGWVNYFDSEYDMRFVGSPTINADGSVRFVNRASSPAVGWCKALIGCDSTQEADYTNRWGAMAIAVVRLVSTNTASSTTFMPFVMGAIPGDDNRPLFETENNDSFWKAYTMGFAGAYGSSSNRYGQSYFRSESGNSWSGVTLDPTKWYIVVCDDTYESSYRYVYFYEINDDGSYTELGNSSNRNSSYSNNSNLNDLTLRYCIGGYHLSDSSWRSTYLQGAKGETEVSSGDYKWPSGNSASTTIDVKFMALADGHNWGWRYKDSQVKSTMLSYLTNTFKEE